jgi:hypothetical protein
MAMASGLWKQGEEMAGEPDQGETKRIVQGHAGGVGGTGLGPLWSGFNGYPTAQHTGGIFPNKGSISNVKRPYERPYTTQGKTR